MTRQRLASAARAVKLGVLLLIAAACFVALVMLWLWNLPPAYWHTTHSALASLSDEQLQDRAERFQIYLTNQLSADRATFDDPTRTVRLPWPLLNAWLRTRLDTWLAHHQVALPPSVTGLMATAHERHAVMAFRFEPGHGGTSQVMSVAVGLEPAGGQKARLRLHVWAGRLALPWDALELHELFTQRLGPDVPTATRRLLGAVLRGEPVRLTIADPSAPGRQLRLIRIDATSETLDLRFAVEPPPRSGL